MKKIQFMTFGDSPALTVARRQLELWGYTITDDPAQATHLLLPVPSFDEGGKVRGAGPLPVLHEGTCVIGGNLQSLAHRKADLLQDEYYLQENAAITAQCAMTRLPEPAGKRVLILGLGRIGRVLGQLLLQQKARVDVAVRSEEKRRAALALGMQPVYPQDWTLTQYDAIFNTVPMPMLEQSQAREDALLVDLASQRGIAGNRVDHALALPGKEAPQLSGTLIAKTALRYALEKEETICK